MRENGINLNSLRKCLACSVCLLSFCAPLVFVSRTAAELDIVNHYSPRNRERPRRRSTDYIILHTTEGAGKGSLKKVHRNGEAHYFVKRNGKVYRIIDRRRVAFHCGRSMWNGRRNIDNHSLGIEVVGYHNGSLTSAQYSALKELVSDLQRIYRVPDERVLTHSMVAYGAPNRWHKRSHRGRKRCGMLFARRSVRRRLGLHRKPLYDPDVRSGRLTVGDTYLAGALYGTAREQSRAVAGMSGPGSGVISPGVSAWDIAREKYNNAGTTYIFPDGKRFRGNQIRNWKKIPPGTRVITGESLRENEVEGVKTLGVHGDTASSIAGDEYNSNTTVYFLPNKTIRTGDRINDKELSSLPRGTRMLVGYISGGVITLGKSAFDLCGKRWNFPSTFYWFPDGTIRPGNTVDENRIPKGSRLFFRN